MTFSEPRVTASSVCATLSECDERRMGTEAGGDRERRTGKKICILKNVA